MKTSNKILLGFLIVIFLIPLLVLMSFNNKIKNGRYTVERQEGQGSNFRSGSFKPYKVVKFIAPAGRVLTADLQQSDSLYYSYHLMGGGDSLRVYNEADTLFVYYFNDQETERIDERAHLRIDLKLPSFDNLIIDNAEVTLDSTNAITSKDLTAEIYGTGILNIGRMKEQRGAPDDADIVEFPHMLDRLNVKMHEGELVLGSKSDVKQMTVTIDGAGVLTINDGAAIGVVTGSLSESSLVKASWKYVKRLATLATQ